MPVCVYVRPPPLEKKARAMFQSAEERDTEGLSPPSYLSVPIYTDMIERGKQTGQQQKKKKQLYAIS